MRTIQNIEVFPIRLPITSTFRFASGSAGQPLRNYLGGSSDRNTVVLSYTLTAHEVEAVQREVLDDMERGFRHFNFKAAVTPETDMALAKVIRRTAGPDAFVWADANQ